MNIQTAIQKVKVKPKIIFLIDGIGALVTSLSLFGIGFWLQEYSGMPKSVLYTLSSTVAFYAIYSLSCYFFLFDKQVGKNENTLKKWQSFLKVIIVANLLYCVAMPFLLVFHFDRLTVLGISYFIFEMIVILALVIFEIKVASN